ncbi:MAG: alpha/beta hydrolase [Alphaproteobacteria bacterium]|nr:alpha/beta hydrolase [Alphaproteobacteria bacterium]
MRKSRHMQDGAVSYLEWESDAPCLVFAHANGFNAETYKSILAPLSDRLRIIAIDQRGHGFTTLPTPPGFARQWLVFRDDLIRFLDGLGTGPVILAGHSLGGSASLMAAVARPDLVRGLVLVEPVLVPPRLAVPMHVSRLLRMGKPVLPIAQRALRRRANFESAEAMEALYRGRGAFKDWPEDMVHDYVAGGTLANGDGTVRLACAPRAEAEIFDSPHFGLYKLARRLRCPATLIRGTRDSTCAAPMAAAFQRLKPDARVLAVSGASHFLPMERPEIVREEILRIAAVS